MQQESGPGVSAASPPLSALQFGYRATLVAATAAERFQPGHTRADYAPALPDLERFYAIVGIGSDTAFDPSPAARLELACGSCIANVGNARTPGPRAMTSPSRARWPHCRHTSTRPRTTAAGARARTIRRDAPARCTRCSRRRRCRRLGRNRTAAGSFADVDTRESFRGIAAGDDTYGEAEHSELCARPRISPLGAG